MNVYLVSCSELVCRMCFKCAPGDAINRVHHTASVIDEWMIIEHRWNDTDRRNRSNGRKICPSATLSAKTLTRTDLGSNGANCDVRPAVDGLRHDTVHKQEWIHSFCLLMQSNSYRQGSPCVCHKGISGGTAPLFLDLGTRQRTVVGQPHTLSAKPPAQEGTAGTHWIGGCVENALFPAGFQTQDCLASSLVTIPTGPPLHHFNLFGSRQ
jgi:hypothetical protein